MLVGNEIVNVPPYVGLPRLSHQFPVGVVVAEVVAVVVTVDVGMVAVAVDVVIVVVVVVAGGMLVVVAVLVVVEEEQDVMRKDVAIRNVSAVKMTPLFIGPPYLLIIFKVFFVLHDFYSDRRRHLPRLIPGLHHGRGQPQT
jgi:hypothetical protein